MNPWWIIIVLAAICLGAVIPVLVQLRHTLRTLEALLTKTSKRLDETLDEVSDTARRINDLAKELEEGATRLRFLFDVAGDLGKTVSKFRDGMNTAATVATSVLPAVIAGVRAIWPGDKDPGKQADEGELARDRRRGALDETMTAGSGIRPGTDNR